MEFTKTSNKTSEKPSIQIDHKIPDLNSDPSKHLSKNDSLKDNHITQESLDDSQTALGSEKPL